VTTKAALPMQRESVVQPAQAQCILQQLPPAGITAARAVHCVRHSREVDGMMGFHRHCVPDARSNVRVACSLPITKHVAAETAAAAAGHLRKCYWTASSVWSSATVVETCDYACMGITACFRSCGVVMQMPRTYEACCCRHTAPVHHALCKCTY
jgi:hypothetical protein